MEGMPEADEHGVRIYNLRFNAPLGGKFNGNGNAVNDNALECTYSYEVAKPTDIWFDAEETSWCRPSGQKTNTGEDTQECGCSVEEDKTQEVQKIHFTARPEGAEEYEAFSMTIDAPFTWEFRELSAEEKAKIAQLEEEYKKQDEEKEEERKAYFQQLDTQPITQLVGNTLAVPAGGEAIPTEAAVTDNAVVGLYFSAHWCGPCCAFTPKLAEAYNAAREGSANAVEIVFVSSDRDEEEFESYFNTMPWKALPFADRSRKEALGERYRVEGIPTLVLLDATGRLLRSDGVEAVSQEGAAALR